MRIARNAVGLVDVLSLHGKMTGEAELTELHDLLQSLADQGRANVVLDLANVPWIDSGGLGALIRAYYAFVRRDGRLKLSSPNRRVEEALLTIDLYNVFDVYLSESEAIAALVAPFSEHGARWDGGPEDG